MPELGAIRKYFYWSEKRIQKIADDNDIRIAGGRLMTVTTPTFGGVLPQLSGTIGKEAPRRSKIADKIESSIGRLAVSDFATPPPAHFAKGIGSMVFSEFYFNGPTGAAVACTTSLSSAGDNVAVCLFGSVDNFSGEVTGSGRQEKGWYSSNAPAILRFVQSGGRPSSEDAPWLRSTPNLEWYAREAFKIAFEQGESSESDRVIDHPWRRGFSYGHIDGAAEWMAEVFIDVRENVGYPDGPRFSRIVVGAPFWIRTPSPQLLQIYTPQTIARLERDRELKELRMHERRAPGALI